MDRKQLREALAMLGTNVLMLLGIFFVVFSAAESSVSMLQGFYFVVGAVSLFCSGVFAGFLWRGKRDGGP